MPRNLCAFFIALLFGFQAHAMQPASAHQPTKVRQNFRASFTTWERMLFQASALGDCKNLARALEKIKDINVRDKDDNTALHKAACAGHLLIVRILISKGAHADAVNTCYNTCYRDNFHERSEVDHLDARHYTPLHEAAAHGHGEVVEELIRAKANPTLQSYCGNKKYISSKGMTPLELAAYYGHVEVVRKLLNSGTQDVASCWFALTSAIREGHMPVVMELLNRGIDVNIRHGHFLHRAASRNRLEMVRELLARGADSNKHKGREEGTPLYAAVSHDNTEVAHEFLRHNANIFNCMPLNPWIRAETLLHRAAARGQTEILVELIRRGIPIQAEDYLGRTPLHDAAKNNQIAAIVELLKRGAAIDAPDKHKKPPLSGGNKYTARLLIQWGSDYAKLWGKDYPSSVLRKIPQLDDIFKDEYHLISVIRDNNVGLMHFLDKNPNTHQAVEALLYAIGQKRITLVRLLVSRLTNLRDIDGLKKGVDFLKTLMNRPNLTEEQQAHYLTMRWEPALFLIHLMNRPVRPIPPDVQRIILDLVFPQPETLQSGKPDCSTS